MAGKTTVIFRGPHARLVVGGKTLERNGAPVALTDEEWALLQAQNTKGRWVLEQVVPKADDAAVAPTSRGGGN